MSKGKEQWLCYSAWQVTCRHTCELQTLQYICTQAHWPQKGIWAGVVICLEQGADMHMAIVPFSCPFTRTHTFNGLFSGWAGTRKVKPIRILLKQETVSGSGISWAICKSAPCSRQITMPAPHHSVIYRPDALPATQTASMHIIFIVDHVILLLLICCCLAG